MTCQIKLTLILIIILAGKTLEAQESDSSASRSLYSITEGYWIRDSIVITLNDIGFNKNSVLMIEEPVALNSDTGFIVIDRLSEDDDVMAVGKIVETNKTKYLYLLDERDNQGKVIKNPDPANVSTYEWSFMGFGNHTLEEDAIILREYLEGSLEARGKKWYLFMILFKERKNESMQIYCKHIE